MFINLHRHSAASLLRGRDGMGTPDQGIIFAKELEQTMLGLTDHGSLMSTPEHYLAGKKYGVKPIIGIEAYFTLKFDHESETHKKHHIAHQTFFAQTLDGYHSLSKGQTEVERGGAQFYKKPTWDLSTLKAHNKDIVCLSGCISGYVPWLILEGRIDDARKVVRKFLEIFGDRYYFEVMPNMLSEQKLVNQVILQFAKEFNRPAVMTYDSHYVHEDDYSTLKVMSVDKETGADYSRLFMPSEKQVLDLWKQTMGTDGSEYVENTVMVGEQCNVELEFPERVPKVTPDNVDATAILVKSAKEKLVKLGKWDDEYRARLKAELKVIIDRNFVDFFLLTADFMKWAKKKNIAVGPGRGSSCGSLVAYALDIIGVDPIELEIDFERFLNDARKDLPDFDIDFDTLRRDEVIEYVLKKYQGKSAQLGNTIRYKIDNTINDLGKALKVPSNAIERIKFLLEGINYDGRTQTYDTLMLHEELRQYDEQYENIILHFTRLYGQFKGVGKHAAGVAIMSDDIEKYVPLVWIASTQTLQTAYDRWTIPVIGAIKVDFLGLTTLSVMREIETLTGIKAEQIPLNDPSVFAAFSQGDTDGVFQLEEEYAKDILRQMKPDHMRDLIAMLCMIRPTALYLKQPKAYIDGKFGRTTADPIFQQYCYDSYGALIYQEHVMRICRGVADLEWSMVNKIVKSLDRPVLEGDPQEAAFIKGAWKKSQMPEQQAKNLYYRITRYSFNKGHGGGYAVISYWMMWYKVHYPLQFYTASLKFCKSEYRELKIQIAALRSGIPIILPHINGPRSYSVVTFDGEKVIQMGIETLKGVGTVAANSIMKFGPYGSEKDLMRKVKAGTNRKLTSTVVEALKQKGALVFLPQTEEEVIIDEILDKINENLVEWLPGQEKELKVVPIDQIPEFRQLCIAYNSRLLNGKKQRSAA